MTSQPMYRAHIVEYPSTESREVFKTRTVDYGEGWEEETHDYIAHVPEGWEPSQWYIDRFGTNDWIEPDTSKWFKSRSSAADRVEILNNAGYTAIVQRSEPVVWPADGQKKVPDSGVHQVQQAIRTLKRAGLIKSADELI